MAISEQVKQKARKLALQTTLNAMSDDEIKAGLLEATMLMAQADLTDDMVKFGSANIILFSDELTKRKVSGVDSYPNLKLVSRLQ
jgi:hypothetical protein